MKTKIFLFVFLFFVTTVFSQTQWTKYHTNPVLTKGPSNWDIIGIGQPTCLIENDTIKMWYAAVGNDMKARICYAFSTDGINWTKYNNGTPVLNVGNSGDWDSGWLDAPEIVKGPTGYLLYYYGDTAQLSPEISSAYGLATSPDGINWTKYTGNPVFTKGNTSDWDGKWIESPAVIYDTAASIYQMWYTGVNYSNWLIKIGYATSANGINWTKYAGNPVLSGGPSGSFDDMWVSVPAVLKRNNTYEMWYSAFSSVSGFDTLRIGYATSMNGINWTKDPGNPMFSTVTAPYDSLIDDGGPWAPDIIFDADSNVYKMWFETKGGFLLATSPNLNLGTADDITKNINTINIYPNPCAGTFYIETDLPVEDASIQIFNSFGQVVEEKNNLHGNKVHIEEKKIPDGIYFIQLKEKEIIITRKLIVQKIVNKENI